MSLLREIQIAVLNERSELAPILLKLRLLAGRLESQPLADWVRHESEGYPADVALPSYRQIPVTYTASFAGSFGSAINNAPIPPYLIEEFAGAHWNNYEMRQSIAAIDDLMIGVRQESGTLTINAANLILLLQGKIYDGYSCHEVTGRISASSLASLRHQVRSRVLELTIELEKSIPESANISIDKSPKSSAEQSSVATQIAQQIIYGNVTTVSAGPGASVSVVVSERDISSLQRYLIESGLERADAAELAEILASEEPESKAEPLGAKAKEWFLKNLKKAASGTWKIGVSVATDVIKEAALRYYGLK